MVTASNPDKHQLAGLDDRERGFSRPVNIEPATDGYRAVLRYEAVHLATESQPTQDLALQVMIRTLQQQGFRQLRTRMSFRNGVYLGSQELWVEYPDLEPEQGPTRFLDRIVRWFRRSSMPHERP